jgi:hypothetical protein
MCGGMHSNTGLWREHGGGYGIQRECGVAWGLVPTDADYGMGRMSRLLGVLALLASLLWLCRAWL